MSSNRRNGNAAEAFALVKLRGEHPNDLVLHLQQDQPADIAQIDGSCRCRCGVYEVKGSKIRRRALRAKLTPAEQALKDRLGDRYVVVRVLRIPGRPKDRFEVLSRGA